MTYQDVLDLINTKLASSAKIPASKHRTVETALLNYIEGSLQPILNYLPKNRGYFDTGDLPGTNVNFTVGGNILSATLGERTSLGINVTCVIANSMADTNYKVIISPQSLISLEFDNDIRPPVFRIDSTTTFSVYIEKLVTDTSTKNIRIHLDVIQL